LERSPDISSFEDSMKIELKDIMLSKYKNALVIDNSAGERNDPVWSKLVPNYDDKSWWAKLDGAKAWWSMEHPQTPSKNVDVTVAWEKSREGAEQLVEKLEESTSFSPPERLHATHELQSRLQLFKSVYEQNNNVKNSETSPKYRARIVATQGPSGTKCPRYHTDWVPLRLICALKGPGVVFVNDDHVDNLEWRSVINKSDEVDSLLFNREVEKHIPENAVVHAKSGDSVLLVGNAWADKISGLLSAVHRSPYLDKDEGRVLLTVDVLDF
jgi:hypothetical protein